MVQLYGAGDAQFHLNYLSILQPP